LTKESMEPQILNILRFWQLKDKFNFNILRFWESKDKSNLNILRFPQSKDKYARTALLSESTMVTQWIGSGLLTLFHRCRVQFLKNLRRRFLRVETWKFPIYYWPYYHHGSRAS
jgi:hypothetical protein